MFFTNEINMIQPVNNKHKKAEFHITTATKTNIYDRMRYPVR